MRRLALALVCSSFALPAFAAPAARPAPSWQVYQQGTHLALAFDRHSLRNEAGLLHFTHEERFAEKQYAPEFKVSFFYRRTHVVADCAKYRFAFISTDLFGQRGEPVYQSLYTLQDFKWVFNAAPEGSIGAAMLDAVCPLAPR